MQSNQTLSPTQLFKSLQREATLSDRVTDQIENLIIANHLQPGDQLPPERELARQFGVSRTVVREAIRGLVAKSLLEVRSGGGTVVRRPTAEVVAQSMSLFLRGAQPTVNYEKIHEVRRLLEIEIAGLAAERHTEADLVRIEENLARIDIAFHAALAQATHNELFNLLLDSLADIMYEVRISGFTVPNAMARGLTYHSAIFEQVQASNPAGARRAMSEHLAEAAETQRHTLALKRENNS
ncbi:MAG: FadR family transcriptional regulator [Chloroflexi bacterium]|nr:FadR family transcriptional regulator [Chloroflexota bacterium]